MKKFLDIFNWRKIFAHAHLDPSPRVIFLDIDGVLNCVHTKQRWDDVMGIDPRMVAVFNHIVRATNARVVLSSTWRLDEDWRTTMRANGIETEFIDRTPYLNGGSRHDEITQWLARHSEITRYAIIDDDAAMPAGAHIFKTTFEKGLTEKIARAVIRHLNAASTE